MANKHIQDGIFDAVAENELAKKKSAKYRAELRYRLRKAEKGECSYGSCHEVTRGGMCEVHRQKVKQMREKRNEQHKSL